MSPLIDKSRLEIKLGTYGTLPAPALSDPLIWPKVQEYRRTTGMRITSMDKPGIRTRIPAGAFHVSRKVDGEFTVLVVADGEAFTVNPGGTVRVGLPFITEAANLLKKAGVKHAMIAGELYCQAPNGKRPRVHDVSRVARKPESAEDLASLRFAAFDILSLERGPAPQSFEQTWNRITEIFGKGKLAHAVEAIPCKDCEGIANAYSTWVEKEGAEGVVARSDSLGFFKIKPTVSLDAVVIGFAEGTEERVGMLHDMLVAIIRPDETLQILGRVGGGFSDEQRRSLLSDFKDMLVESEYVEVNSDRVAYQMIRPELVCELSCLDLVTQTTRGATVDRMVLDWNASGGRYEVVRRLPLASMISPQFVRMRDDKKPVVTDVRIQQITDLVDVPMWEREARKLALAKSEVLNRAVYTKTLKGAQMARKLVLWKTNKHEIADDFPAYVIYYTDYSPNRKTPLEFDIRVSDSEEQIGQLWDEMAAENFVKGWNVVP